MLGQLTYSSSRLCHQKTGVNDPDTAIISGTSLSGSQRREESVQGQKPRRINMFIGRRYLEKEKEKKMDIKRIRRKRKKVKQRGRRGRLLPSLKVYEEIGDYRSALPVLCNTRFCFVDSSKFSANS